MDKYEIADYLPKIKLKILDYNCGIGETSYFLAKQNKDWTVIGCDTIENLAQTLRYYSVEYPNQLEPPNITFKPTLSAIKEIFDYAIYCNTKPNVKSSYFIEIQR